jgi:hypothetical protein
MTGDLWHKGKMKRRRLVIELVEMPPPLLV